MDRYLVQFRRRDQQGFVSDCGFRECQLQLAKRYVCVVVATLGTCVEGRIVDLRTRAYVFRHP